MQLLHCPLGKLYFSISNGWKAKDSSKIYGGGRDFEFYKGNKTVYCEVKGLEGSPDYVFVTRNEYLKSKEYGENSALYIVHNIDCDESDPPVASGGEVLFFHPWEPNDPENCEPHTYKFYPDDY